LRKGLKDYYFEEKVGFKRSIINSKIHQVVEKESFMKKMLLQITGV
jgi:hypothetical protein